jgi:hypothetical protein
MMNQAQRGALSQVRPTTFGQNYYSPYQQYQPQGYMPYSSPYQYQYTPMMAQGYAQPAYHPQMMAPMMQMQMPMPMMGGYGGYGGYNPNPYAYQPQPYAPYGVAYNPYPSFGYGYRN